MELAKRRIGTRRKYSKHKEQLDGQLLLEARERLIFQEIKKKKKYSENIFGSKRKNERERESERKIEREY